MPTPVLGKFGRLHPRARRIHRFRFGTVIMACMIPRVKRMPKALAALTGILAACGLICVASALLPSTWRVGDGILALTAGSLMLLLAAGFYRAQAWARYALPVGLAVMALGSAIRPWPNEGPYQWLGSLSCGIVSYWYLFWKRAVVDYFSRARGAEPGAPPNGGPAERLGDSGVGGGPPSVS